MIEHASGITGFITSHEQPLEEVHFETPSEFLWNEAERAAEIGDDVRASLDSLYDECTRLRQSSVHGDRPRADALEAEYWNKFNRLQEMQGIEAAILDVLTQHEEGLITEDELRKFLPEEPEKETVDTKADPKGEPEPITAMDRMELFMMGYTNAWFGYEGENAMQGSRQATDPRRIASGRNRTSWSATGRGLGALSAQQAFFDATADTHGGKSRRPSKDSRHYVGKSGRRIRKR